jgi:hypothetical protein
MRWEFGRRSTNVEDRRGGVSAPIVGGGIGAIVLSLLVALLGGDPSVILEQVNQHSDRPSTELDPTNRPPASDQMADFVSVVLADTEDT